MGFWDWLLGLFKRRKPSRIILNPLASSGRVGEKITITGKLLRRNNMTGIANAAVQVTATDPEGVTAVNNMVTNEDGVFLLDIPLTKVGAYDVRAHFAGNSEYESVTSYCTINAIAAPKPTTLTLTLSETQPRVGQTVTITAKLTS